MAPILTNGSIKLQHFLPHIIRLRTSRVFHGRVPYNVLDLKYGLKPQATAPTNHEIAEGVLQQTQEILNQSQQALMQAYVRHKRYYDRKASAHPLVVNDYCYALHPKAHSQATKLPFREYLWTGPYIVVKTLPNNNYLYVNSRPISHRSCIESGYAPSQAATSCLTLQSHPRNSSRIQK